MRPSTHGAPETPTYYLLQGDTHRVLFPPRHAPPTTRQPRARKTSALFFTACPVTLRVESSCAYLLPLTEKQLFSSVPPPPPVASIQPIHPQPSRKQSAVNIPPRSSTMHFGVTPPPSSSSSSSKTKNNETSQCHQTYTDQDAAPAAVYRTSTPPVVCNPSLPPHLRNNSCLERPCLDAHPSFLRFPFSSACLWHRQQQALKGPPPTSHSAPPPLKPARQKNGFQAFKRQFHLLQVRFHTARLKVRAPLANAGNPSSDSAQGKKANASVVTNHGQAGMTSSQEARSHLSCCSKSRQRFVSCRNVLISSSHQAKNLRVFSGRAIDTGTKPHWLGYTVRRAHGRQNRPQKRRNNEGLQPPHCGFASDV